MQSWTFKPLCMHSNSLPFFQIGLLHIDSFSKYSDTALWHWTQSVMKCASIKKACKERLHNGHIQNLSTFIALCLESHWLSWELYLACFQFLQRKEFFPCSVCLEQPGLGGRVNSACLHQSHSQIWLREVQILTTLCPLFQLLAGRHCCTPQE